MKKIIASVLTLALILSAFGVINNSTTACAAKSRTYIYGYLDSGKKMKVSFQSGKITLSGHYMTKASVFKDYSANKKRKKKTYKVSSNCAASISSYNMLTGNYKKKNMSYSKFLKKCKDYSWKNATIIVEKNKITSVALHVK